MRRCAFKFYFCAPYNIAVTKRKLQHFAELETFANVIQSATYISDFEHPLKGNWNTKFFEKAQPIVLELGCGKGEYSINLAVRYPEKNFIGIDLKGNRLWRGAGRHWTWAWQTWASCAHK